VTLRRGDEGFEGAVVALAGPPVGRRHRLTLDVRPRYEIRRWWHLGWPATPRSST
jgi:hypothetical protein